MKPLTLATAVMCVLTGGIAIADDAKEATDVTLTAGTWQDLQAYVAQNRDKIVVVDVWSTSCLPCMKEFPGLVKLHESFPKDVVCVSFCVDYVGIKSRPPERYREKAEKFLVKQNAAFRNYLSTTASDELFDEIKLSSIPAVYVYGRDGKLAKRFDPSLIEDGKEEAFTYAEDIIPFVKAMQRTK
ncbi:MAG: TlpA disulfide reductase family protein [Planctomycetaceae bacterium]